MSLSQIFATREQFHSDHFNPEMNTYQFFWEAVAIQHTVADPWTALKQWFNRQFSLRFWPVKLAIHLAAWAILSLMFFIGFPRAYTDVNTVRLNGPCETRLDQLCANNIISNCSGEIPFPLQQLTGENIGNRKWSSSGHSEIFQTRPIITLRN